MTPDPSIPITGTGGSLSQTFTWTRPDDVSNEDALREFQFTFTTPAHSITLTVFVVLLDIDADSDNNGYINSNKNTPREVAEDANEQTMA